MAADTVTINGDVYGYTGAGLANYSATTGNLLINGDIYGVSNLGMLIASPLVQVTLSNTTKLYNSNFTAYAGPNPAWVPPSTGFIKGYVGTGFAQAANTNFVQQLDAGNIKVGVTSGTATGTFSNNNMFTSLLEEI